MCFRPASVTKPTRCVCGALNPPGAQECRKCGIELKAEVQKFECPRCGVLNEPTADACTSCGLTAEEAIGYS